MTPIIATGLTLCFIVYLFIRDGARPEEGVSSATYLPSLWFLFAASRFPSQWLSIGSPLSGTIQTFYDGSSLDAITFMLLILAGVVVLQRRHIGFASVMRSNPWVVAYFALGLLSILWSDYPSIAFKRLIKALGNPIMALIVLTEERPDRAISAMIKRAAYIALPISVLMIKYYPDLGRQYHSVGWQMMVGVATSKNQLGQTCLISGICFAWELLVRRRYETEARPQKNLFALLAGAAMTLWLLNMCKSATSLTALAVAVGVIVLSGLPSMQRKPTRILTFALTVAVVLAVLEPLVNLKQTVIVNILGRDMSLTTRVPLWNDLIAMVNRPLLGVGYESFWLGNRWTRLWAVHGQLHQAHNGYLEVYINLGAAGLFLTLGAIVSGFVKIRKRLVSDHQLAILQFASLVAVVIHSWTEASFYAVSSIWMLMFVSAMSGPARQSAEVGREAFAAAPRLDSERSGA
jgi:exopolysaccharide production protein ExoQ